MASGDTKAESIGTRGSGMRFRNANRNLPPRCDMATEEADLQAAASREASRTFQSFPPRLAVVSPPTRWQFFLKPQQLFFCQHVCLFFFFWKTKKTTDNWVETARCIVGGRWLRWQVFGWEGMDPPTQKVFFTHPNHMLQKILKETYRRAFCWMPSKDKKG